jgi:hypothetical protein
MRIHRQLSPRHSSLPTVTLTLGELNPCRLNCRRLNCRSSSVAGSAVISPVLHILTPSPTPRGKKRDFGSAYSASLVEAYEPDSAEKFRKSMGLRSSIQGRKNFGFFQCFFTKLSFFHSGKRPEVAGKIRRFLDPEYYFRFPSISGVFCGKW